MLYLHYVKLVSQLTFRYCWTRSWICMTQSVLFSI